MLLQFNSNSIDEFLSDDKDFSFYLVNIQHNMILKPKIYLEILGFNGKIYISY